MSSLFALFIHTVIVDTVNQALLEEGLEVVRDPLVAVFRAW